MTAIGKMLVFLVLVLSLIWNALVLNAYTARTNWQKEAKKYQAEAAAAAESATKMKALRDVEAESADDAKRALQQERDRYYTQVAQLVTVRDTLNQQYNVAFSEAQKKAATAEQLHAMIEKLSGQIKVIDDELKKADEKGNQLVIAANLARAAQSRAEIERDRYKLQAEAKTEYALKLQDQLTEARLGSGGIPGFRTPVAPAGFNGTVVEVDARTPTVYVEFTPGLDTGLQAGTILRVDRLAPAGVFVGKLTVVRVIGKKGVGVFEPAVKGAAVTADRLPKAGDQVKPY